MDADTATLEDILAEIGKKIDPEFEAAINKAITAHKKLLEDMDKVISKRASIKSSMELLSAGRIPNGCKQLKPGTVPPEYDQPAFGLDSSTTKSITFPPGATIREMKAKLHGEYLALNFWIDDLTFNEKMGQRLGHTQSL